MNEFRTNIKDFLNSKYSGSYRFIKDKMFITQFGLSNYEFIIKETSFLDGSDYSFSVRVRSYVENISIWPECIVCGKRTIFNSNNGWQSTCSRSCHMKSPIRMNKLKNTNLMKYGTTNFLASEEGKSKIKETNLKKYGVDNYAKSKEYKNRILSGDILLNSNPTKISLTSRLSYYNSLLDGDVIEPLFEFSEYEGFSTNKEYNWRCKKCGFEFSAILKYHKHLECRKCKPTGTKMEISIKNFLDDNNIKFIYRDRSVLDGYEIDVYIPSHNLGIELNGLYWHSELFKSKNLHKLKADLADNSGVKLIQIFEDEFKNKNPIVMSRLSNLLKLNYKKIFARNCEIKLVSGNEKKNFLEANHIQSNSNTSINIGLYYQNELVSLMTFSKERISLGVSKSKDGVFELNRFCSKLGFNVVGAAGKLLNYFIKSFNPNKIISYADRRWSSGSLYDKLGFEFIKNTNANYWYTADYTKREHRYSFRKDLLSEKLEIFDPTLSEYDNMKMNGYVKIWDAGSKKYELIIN